MLETWDQMLDAFRALGGVADNVHRRQGASGWGLHPIDPSKPVRIRTPPNLLVDVAHVTFDGGRLSVTQQAELGAPEAEFLESYHAEFSWGAGGRDDCAAFVTAMDALPVGVRSLLTNEFLSGTLFDGDAADRIQRRFLDTRCVRNHASTVLMPVLDLVNHDPAGARFDFADGAAIDGLFAGEVCARYRRADAFLIFKYWGFASAETLAFSLPVFLKLDSHILAVRRLARPEAMRQAATAPKADVRGRFVDFSCLLVGDSANPDRPRDLFRRAIEKFEPHAADAVFDEIVRINRERFVALAAAAGQAGTMASTLRNMCAFQLKAMGDGG